MSFIGDDTTFETRRLALRRIVSTDPTKTLYQIVVEGVIKRDNQAEAQEIFNQLQRVFSKYDEVALRMQPIELVRI